jgi:hypothetical protein
MSPAGDLAALKEGLAPFERPDALFVVVEPRGELAVGGIAHHHVIGEDLPQFSKSCLHLAAKSVVLPNRLNSTDQVFVEDAHVPPQVDDLYFELDDVDRVSGYSRLELGDVGLEFGDVGLEFGDVGLEFGDVGLELCHIGLELSHIGCNAVESLLYPLGSFFGHRNTHPRWDDDDSIVGLPMS